MPHQLTAGFSFHPDCWFHIKAGAATRSTPTASEAQMTRGTGGTGTQDSRQITTHVIAAVALIAKPATLIAKMITGRSLVTPGSGR